eukprot:COSAG01_NODE_874_length_12972_cov_15.914343_12_plen_38_part_00
MDLFNEESGQPEGDAAAVAAELERGGLRTSLLAQLFS